MKTTQPSKAHNFTSSSSLVAANEPSMPQARRERASSRPADRGWDPYDVWRTRVKAPRESDAPAS